MRLQVSMLDQGLSTVSPAPLSKASFEACLISSTEEQSGALVLVPDLYAIRDCTRWDPLT
jgi:hypothetical protein